MRAEIGFMEYKSVYLIKHFCPNIINLYNPTEKEWKRIESKLQKKYDFLEEKIKIYNQYDSETCFFDLILRSNDKTDSTNGFCNSIVKFIDDNFKSLYNLIPKESHKLLKKTVLNFLENFDNEKSRYLDNLGELIGLNQLLKYPKFKFKSIEKKNLNGTSFDFYIKDDLNKDYLIEVYNIHLNADLLNSTNDIKLFLGKRLKDKIIKKKIDNKNFSLMIVLWGDFEKLTKFKDFFSENNLFDKIEVIFCTLVQYKKDDKNYLFEFATIESLIDKYLTIKNARTTDNKP
jgi:hypothetical protein